MGFYATAVHSDRPALVPGQPVTPSKNRVWDFFETSEYHVGSFTSQVFDPHQETRDTSIKTVSGRANGNITDYVDAGGAVVAHREYDPFGNTVKATGSMVNDFHHWFSSKYLDAETGLYYYGYRFYSPTLSKWPSRDPLWEQGGVHLYEFVGNEPAGSWDILGRQGEDIGDLYPTPEPVFPVNPIPSVPGPQGRIDYPIPDWFKNPADEGKPCCCTPPAQLTGFAHSDNTTVWSPYITMNVKYKISGCFKDMALLWWTCWRPDGTGGVLPGCVNSPSCSFFGGATSLMGPYLTQVRLRYLSCENDKWVKHEEKAGHTYFWGWFGWY